MRPEFSTEVGHPRESESTGRAMKMGHHANRRDFLKQAGTVAWATPIILTMAADPARAQATSCLAPGEPCGTWDTELAMCIPILEEGICCNSCDVRGTGADFQFCFCS